MNVNRIKKYQSFCRYWTKSNADYNEHIWSKTCELYQREVDWLGSMGIEKCFIDTDGIVTKPLQLVIRYVVKLHAVQTAYKELFGTAYKRLFFELMKFFKCLLIPSSPDRYIEHLKHITFEISNKKTWICKWRSSSNYFMKKKE